MCPRELVLLVGQVVLVEEQVVNVEEQEFNFVIDVLPIFSKADVSDQQVPVHECKGSCQSLSRAWAFEAGLCTDGTDCANVALVLGHDPGCNVQNFPGVVVDMFLIAKTFIRYDQHVVSIALAALHSFDNESGGTP